MENKNNCTLLVDGNWMLMWRLFSCKEYVTKANLDSGLYTRTEAINEIKKTLAQALSYKLYALKDIVDNFIYISDDSSWRKDLPIPRALTPEVNPYLLTNKYKGQRIKDDELDWDIIYTAHKEFIQSLENIGITCSHLSKIEGDDWVFWWSRNLNAQGINCIIWSKDQDLKQLIKYDEPTDVFTVWMNDDNGVYMPDNLKNKSLKSNDIMDLFDISDDTQSTNQYIYKLRNLFKDKIDYLNPMIIIITKIISGDAGDNIQPIIYKYSGDKPRRYKATESDVGIVVRGDLKLYDINDVFTNKEIILRKLMSLNKFKTQKFNYDIISEHFEYNKKLVWLDESQYPEKILLEFVQIPYKIVKNIETYYNWQQLIPDTAHINYLENLFNQI